MRPSLGLALSVSVVGLVLVACNALTGASNLGICEGVECTYLQSPDRVDGGGDGSPTVMPEGGMVELPPTCNGTETACAGRVLGTCVAGIFQKTTCPEACNAGKCDSWPSCRNAAGFGCGADGAATSCCETGSVPGGTFMRRGSSSAPATVSPFELDKYEVTVGRMRAFIEAGGVSKGSPPANGVGANPKIAGSGWNPVWNTFLPNDINALKTLLKQASPTWTDAPGTHEHKPINSVNWFVAAAFCAWDGGRLPTYAEMNFAASGGSEQRIYPWSVPPNPDAISRANAAYYCGYDLPVYNCPATYCSNDPATPSCDPAVCIAPDMCVTPPCVGCSSAVDIAPVGMLPAGVGKWGHFDLSGNMAELVFDVEGALSAPCVDCAQIPPDIIRGPVNSPRLDAFFLVTGGGWTSASTASVLRTTAYTTLRDRDVSDGIGFRCAR
jgi:formylglycine-generating enzyme required for sulfatase activity